MTTDQIDISPPPADLDAPLSAQELAVLRALHDTMGRVVSRRELARRVGIADRNERRCDSLLVGLRRVLGPHAITTVRSRGWMLERRSASAVEELLARHSSV